MINLKQCAGNDVGGVGEAVRLFGNVVGVRVCRCCCVYVGVAARAIGPGKA